MSTPCHIASLVVRCQPDHLGNVQAALASIENLDIHAADPSGKIVVVLSTESSNDISEFSKTCTQFNGVLSCDLVFHAVDDDEDAPLQESHS